VTSVPPGAGQEAAAVGEDLGVEALGGGPEEGAQVEGHLGVVEDAERLDEAHRARRQQAGQEGDAGAVAELRRAQGGPDGRDGALGEDGVVVSRVDHQEFGGGAQVLGSVTEIHQRVIACALASRRHSFLVWEEQLDIADPLPEAVGVSVEVALDVDHHQRASEGADHSLGQHGLASL
jgi:hypothetical protein